MMKLQLMEDGSLLVYRVQAGRVWDASLKVFLTYRLEAISKKSGSCQTSCTFVIFFIKRIVSFLFFTPWFQDGCPRARCSNLTREKVRVASANHSYAFYQNLQHVSSSLCSPYITWSLFGKQKRSVSSSGRWKVRTRDLAARWGHKQWNKQRLFKDWDACRKGRVQISL